jgi:hypothetical protein
MGSPDARAYSRNKRGIAGSLIWINFDGHSLLNFIQKCAGTFVADIDEIRHQYTNVADGEAVFQSSVVRSAGIPVTATIDQLDTTLTSAGQNAPLATPWYSDQALPFDVTLASQRIRRDVQRQDLRPQDPERRVPDQVSPSCLTQENLAHARASRTPPQIPLRV